MESNTVNEIINSCEWASSKFLIFSDNVFGPLIYYSHLTPLVLLIIFGIFIFLSGRKNIINQVLAFITLLLSIWIFSDLVLWATEMSQMTMFFWSITILVEPIIYGALAYFVYLFIEKKDLSFWKKFLIIIPLLPTIFLTPTPFALLGIDLTNCDREAVEGVLVYYGYIVEIIFSLWIVFFGIKSYIKRKTLDEKKQVSLITIGAVLFLLTFASGNIVGSLSVDWTLGQYGLFGIPIFVGFLSYLIVKFKALNIKMVGAQALVVALLLALFAILFVREISLARIVVGFTLIPVGILGIMLVKSVKKERLQLEKIADLASSLEQSNKNLTSANERLKELDQQKSEFVSLASHQLRGPLAAIKGYTSMVLEGDFGKINKEARQAMETIFKSTEALVVLVGDYLDVSRIEQGRMKYDFSDFDLKTLAETVVTEMTPNIKIEKLKLSLDFEKDKDYLIHADQGKIKQVISNIIDNAVKYTKEGIIEIFISKKDKKVLISIKDNGVGIPPEVLPRLFEKFTRAPDASKTNIMGTGLGLYVAKKMIEAHKGRIWAESKGKGLGSTFFIELDAMNEDKKINPPKVDETEARVEKFAKEL